MSAALQVYYEAFDRDFFRLPLNVRLRIEAKIDQLGLQLDSFPHHQLRQQSLPGCGWVIIE